jgi:hypothetical protein
LAVLAFTETEPVTVLPSNSFVSGCPQRLMEQTDVELLSENEPLGDSHTATSSGAASTSQLRTPASRASPFMTCATPRARGSPRAGSVPARSPPRWDSKRTSTTEIYIQRFNGDAADERVREAMSG